MPNPSELERQREPMQRAVSKTSRKCFGDFEDYTPDEIEFMNAMQRFKEDHRRRRTLTAGTSSVCCVGLVMRRIGSRDPVGMYLADSLRRTWDSTHVIGQSVLVLGSRVT